MLGRVAAQLAEPEEGPVTLAPPPGGTRIRIVEFSPEDDTAAPVSPEEAQAQFAAMGAESASRHSGADSRHAFMHRTETIDYGIVLEGELVLIMDEGETTVRAGDIVIQRGTNHGWANRSDAPCRICFVLIDGEFAQGLEN